MGKKRKYKGKYQMGGTLSSLFGGFGGGKGMEVLGQIGNALQGFSNEPALSGIFNQSQTLLNRFKDKLSDQQLEQLGGESSLKPMFDLASLFSNSLFGGSFEEGGEVSKDLDERFGEFIGTLKDEVVEEEYEVNKSMMINAFNMQNMSKPIDEKQIIPGLNRGNGGVSYGGKMQQGGVPVSSRGQFEFPGQPVMVPTPDGSITMNGVNQDILAVQNGNVSMLPANSGMHQFQPGMVMEIPLPRKRRRGKTKGKKDDNKGISTRIPTATSKRYHRRNKKQMQLNKRGNIGLPFGKRY